jgi:hypothetical protein
MNNEPRVYDGDLVGLGSVLTRFMGMAYFMG